MGVIPVTLLVCLSLGGFALGKRIMLMPGPWLSHVSYFTHIGEMLQHRYGHEIIIVLPNTYPGPVSTTFKKVTFNVTVPDFYTVQVDRKSAEEVFMSLREMGFANYGLRDKIAMKSRLSWCDDLHGDILMFDKLLSLKIDFAICDLSAVCRCFVLLPYRLGIPYASLGTQYDLSPTRSPLLPSFVPFKLGTVYTEVMDFGERLRNLVLLADWSAFPRCPFIDDSLVEKYAIDKPYQTLNDLFGKSKLVMLNVDVLLENAKPLLPNVIEVGGLTAKPAKQLASHIDDAVALGKLGTIVVSFGTLADMAPMTIMVKLADAFRKFSDYTIVWKYTGEVPIKDLPSSIKLIPWLPQNDLLGDNRTRLFITHCGNSGQYEALYHGVPMVGIGLFGDQHYNAARMAHNGYGVTLDMDNFTSKELVDSMNMVLSDPKYKAKIEKASTIFRRKTHPLKRAGYWINHVLMFGVGHLHSHGIQLPWYKYIMLDVLVFMCCLIAVPTAVLYVKFCI